MIDDNVIAEIKAELYRDGDVPASWGIFNEKPALTANHLTAYTFQVDGALLFTGLVEIVKYPDGYGFVLVSSNKPFYTSAMYNLKQCIKELDKKIESGPSQRSYKKHVEQWLKEK